MYRMSRGAICPEQQQPGCQKQPSHTRLGKDSDTEHIPDGKDGDGSVQGNERAWEMGFVQAQRFTGLGKPWATCRLGPRARHPVLCLECSSQGLRVAVSLLSETQVSTQLSPF